MLSSLAPDDDLLLIVCLATFFKILQTS